nr:flagellar assembly protein FliW [uncultured Agathobaculum sp.]
MNIQTKYFGELRIDDSTTLRFADGLFGFEEEKEFVLLPFSEEDDFLLCLQSVKTPFLAFTLLNPFMIMPEYRPQPAAEELQRLEVGKSEDLCYYVLCRVESPVSESTVNLRCPIALNDQTRQARQVILEDYEMRRSLSSLGKRDNGAC